jgi:carbon monoxide dehydrogenase subunit G
MKPTKIVSKIGKINSSAQSIYNYLSNFKNFDRIAQHPDIKNWEATEDTCHFSVKGFNNIGMKIKNREPYKTIQIASDGKTPFEFLLWIQLLDKGPYDTRIRITVHAKLNPVMKMMLGKTLTKFVNNAVDQLEMSHF